MINMFYVEIQKVQPCFFRFQLTYIIYDFFIINFGSEINSKSLHRGSRNKECQFTSIQRVQLGCFIGAIFSLDTDF